MEFEPTLQLDPSKTDPKVLRMQELKAAVDEYAGIVEQAVGSINYYLEEKRKENYRKERSKPLKVTDEEFFRLVNSAIDGTTLQTTAIEGEVYLLPVESNYWAYDKIKFIRIRRQKDTVHAFG
jgi:hypothetical protein